VDEDDVRQRSLILRVSDRLDDPTLPADVRQELQAASADAHRSMHKLFGAMVRDDARRRGD
jgi:hypothetical protein